MDDLGLLLPFWKSVGELLEVLVEASLSGVLICLHCSQSHNMVRFGQVFCISIVFAHLIDLLWIVLIVLGIEVPLNDHVWLEFLEVVMDVLLQRSPLMTTWTVRFA